MLIFWKRVIGFYFCFYGCRTGATKSIEIKRRTHRLNSLSFDQFGAASEVFDMKGRLLSVAPKRVLKTLTGLRRRASILAWPTGRSRTYKSEALNRLGVTWEGAMGRKSLKRQNGAN